MKKKLTENQKLTTAFNLTYANICSVFITKNKAYFIVVQKGFKIQKDIEMCFFDKNTLIRYKFITLDQAIHCFNKIVNIVTSTIDWFEPDFFEKEWYLKNELNDVY